MNPPAGSNCVVINSSNGTHPAIIETCGYTTTITNFVASTSSSPNYLVAVNDVPSSFYGYNDQGLGLCNFIPAGSVYQGKGQNPNKITNYDNNHIVKSNAGKVNFVQVNMTASANLEFKITGEEFGHEYFAVYCSSTQGQLGTLNSYSNKFSTWLALSLPKDGTCDYVSFTPYTYLNGPAPAADWCPHTAILVNFQVTCTPPTTVALNTPIDTYSVSSGGSNTSSNNNTIIAVVSVVVGAILLGAVGAYAYFASAAAKAAEAAPLATGVNV